MRKASAGGAASVASQLRAFSRDPSHWRPRFLRGKEPLPDGTFVLRFAQGRFPRGLVRATTALEREELRDAANAFIRQVCFWEGATHYQVLCAPPQARREAIKEHYHLLMALIHPDRQDAAFEPWPMGCPQRVNHAYQVLSDAELRREYDASLYRSAASSTFPPHLAEAERSARARRRPARIGLLKSLTVLGAVAVTLLLLEVTLSDSSDRYSMLQGAFSTRGGRDLASTERPRYIGAETAALRERPVEASEEPRRAENTSFLRSLWRAWDRSEDQVAAPERTAAASVAIPPAAPAKPEIVAAAPAAPAKPEIAAAAPVEPPARARTMTVAQAQSAPPAAIAKAPDSAVSAEQIEILVARFIGYYEAGETEKLLSLVDSAETGFWQAARTRQAYSDFFRSTRQRKLRVNNLAWQTGEHSARAKGEATVLAEYFDAPGMLERRVDLEMDIAMRDGMPKITRLSLFPDMR